MIENMWIIMEGIVTPEEVITIGTGPHQTVTEIQEEVIIGEIEPLQTVLEIGPHQTIMIEVEEIRMETEEMEEVAQAVDIVVTEEEQETDTMESIEKDLKI